MKIRELDHPRSHGKHARSLFASFTAIVIAAGALVVTPTATHAAETPTIASAKLQWAVSPNLNTYVRSSHVPGTITPLGANTSPSEWNAATGSVSQQGDSADVSFGVGNGVRYEGFKSPSTGINSLDISITNPRVQMTSATTGKLYVDIAGTNFTMDGSTPSINFTNSGEHFADITATAPTITQKTITWDQAQTTITEAGASHFSALLKPGAALDPITLSVTLNSVDNPTATTTTAAAAAAAVNSGSPTATLDQISPQQASTQPPPRPLEGGCRTSPVTAGSVNWLVRASFINYLTKGAGGSYTGGTFAVTGGSITQNGATVTGEIHTTGEFHATGHHGILDLKFKDPTITFTGTNTATLSVVMHSNDMSGKPIADSGKRVEIAALDASSLTITENSISSTGLAASLTNTGSTAFAGQYEPGASLDPVPVNIVLGASIPCNEPEQIIPVIPASEFAAAVEPDLRVMPSLTLQTQGSHASQERSAHAAHTPEMHATTPGISAPTQSASTLTSPPSRNTTVPPLPAPETCVARAVTSGSINWLIRASFINYLGKNFVKGSYSGGAFTVTGGSINSKNGITGIIHTSGEFHATGHTGKLDLKLSNLDIKFNGSNTAVLSAVMSSNDTSGTPTPNSGKRVEIATLNISGLSVQGNTLSSSGAPAVLTAAGAEAFAGFYEAGEALDPVPFTATLGSDVPCDSFSDPGSPANSGKLAVTGTETQTATVALVALLMLLTGAAISRQNQRQRHLVND